MAEHWGSTNVSVELLRPRMSCSLRDDTSRVIASTGTAARRRATTTSLWPLEAARCSAVQSSCALCPPNGLQLNELFSRLYGVSTCRKGLPLCEVSCSRRRAKPISKDESGAYLVYNPCAQCQQGFNQGSVVVDDCPPQCLCHGGPECQIRQPHSCGRGGRGGSATHLILHLLRGETESGPVLQCVHHRCCVWLALRGDLCSEVFKFAGGEEAVGGPA